MTQETGGKLLSSIDNTCKRLDVGRTTVYELLKTGRLKAIKVGSKTLITEASILAMIADLAGENHREVA